MNKVMSIFRQILHIFPKTKLIQPVSDIKSQKALKGFSAWTNHQLKENVIKEFNVFSLYPPDAGWPPGLRQLACRFDTSRQTGATQRPYYTVVFDTAAHNDKFPIK